MNDRRRTVQSAQPHMNRRSAFLPTSGQHFKGMIDFHSSLIVKEVSAKCIEFAERINAIRISGSIIHEHIRSAIVAHNMLLDPEPLFDRIRWMLEEAGIDIK